jgi:hypothetical protein
MDTLAQFTCDVSTTNSDVPLGFELWFDGLLVDRIEHVCGTVNIQHDFSDADDEHEIKFVMKNKQPEHTTVNEQGEIVGDACLVISNAAFEGIELNHTLVEQTQYTHDFNGTGDAVTEPFYGTLGCNGHVTLRFTTPVYLWLLEHM